MTTPPVLDIEDLQVRFRARHGVVSALRGPDLRLDAGGLLVVVGESGSGKTVLATALLGMLPSNAEVTGSVQVLGNQVVGASSRQLRALRRDHVALIPQGASTALNPVRTIGWQARRTVRTRRLDPQQGAARIDLELDASGLSPIDTRRAYPHELSGGMQQRVLLALSRAADPDLVIADEPTHGLDADLVDATARRLLEVQQTGAALLVITHDLRLAAALGGETAVLYGGDLLERQATLPLLDRPAHPYTRGLIGALPERGANPIVGSPPDLSALPPGCSFAPRCPLVRADCTTALPALEPIGETGMVRCPYHHEADQDMASHAAAPEQDRHAPR